MERRRFVMRQGYLHAVCDRCGIQVQAEPNPYTQTKNMGACTVKVKPNQRCGGTLWAKDPPKPPALVRRAPVEATQDDARELEADLEKLERDIGREA